MSEAVQEKDEGSTAEATCAALTSVSCGAATTACVVKVLLKEPLPWETPASKLRMPACATVKWSHGGVDEDGLRFLDQGLASDCFRADEHSYVLKVQDGDSLYSTFMEYGSGPCALLVHGCVLVKWQASKCLR